MSGSGFEESNSFHNQTNSTEFIPKMNILSVVLSIMVCTQLLLCAIALIAIVRVRALRVGQNVYIINLILSDVAHILVAFLAVTRSLMKYNVGNQEAKNICVTTLFIVYAQFFWSMWGAVLLQYSRYSTVRDPLAPGVSTRKATIASTITCAIGIVIAVPPFFTWAKYTLTYAIEDGQYIEQCFANFSNPTNHISFTFFYYTVSYWLPVAVTIYYLLRTLKIVITSANERRRLTDPTTSNRTKTEPSATTTPPLYKSKALWYVIVLVGSNVLLPPFFVVLHILHAFFRIDQNLLFAASVPFLINLFINSLIYCFWVKTLTRHLGDVLRCRKLQRIVRN